MKALIDTCVIIDAMQNRVPFSSFAQKILLHVANKSFIGYITAKESTDIYYLMRHYTHNETESRKILNKLFSIFDIIDTDGIDCRNAIPSKCPDYEDAVMIETAKRYEVDCIITRNVKDFNSSTVSIYTPEQFIDFLEKN